MLLPQFVSLTLITLSLQVKSDPLLCNKAWLQFTKHGNRTLFHNIEHIDSISLTIDVHISTLIIHAKKLTTLQAEAIRNLPDLKTLQLTNCQIEILIANAFYNLPHLKVINLSDNNLEKIPENVFNNLSIETLFLQRNQIRSINSEAFNNMLTLRKIQLNNNKLKSWDPEWFRNCPHLSEVYVRRNQIQVLPSGAFTLISKPNLSLFLSANKLGVVLGFQGLKHVGQLWLDRNRIVKVEEGAFPDLESSNVLYLARNRIRNFPEGALPRVQQLGIVDFSSNFLECLPYGIVSVANLTNLDRNNLTCECVEALERRLKEEKKIVQINYDACNDNK